ncbi:hypothetical protein CWE12_06645 [Aliidiomarina sedimenti]|uniref:Transmembrane protein (PGPGW) n=1 Tax=Aliidiomarina sedimenti TaxID=1933879 RepID=A0ABY0C1H3_9GAMM|nr:hypothetical protein [Aliidiomarina sedimenti]RUO30911.1 hypothetical protein CWE12_06645 [Aliidiomarina sedimenti]
MIEGLVAAFDWIQPYLPWLTSISVILAVVSLVVLPVLIIYMPKDYFLGAHRRRRRGLSSYWFTTARNLLALVLMVAGLLMLVLPGQGLLTLLAALIMSDVPGKYRMERWVVLQPGVLRTINWVRRKYKKAPILAPPTGHNRKRPPRITG